MTTYVTVAIPSVNAQPHLAYAYELVLTEVKASSGHASDRQAIRRAAAQWAEFEAPLLPTTIRFDEAAVDASCLPEEGARASCLF